MPLSPGQRAGQQLLESGAITVILILIFEWVAPWAVGRQVDWAQFLFACIFGLQIIILHTALAYVRPLSKLELRAMVEDAMRAEAMERTHPELPRVRQMATWSMNDPAWTPDPTLPETLPLLPAVRPVPLAERS